VVFVERGQRKILVNYAKRQVGNKVYGGQSSHLPLKLNMAGVIPPIFASSIILLPATVVGWFSHRRRHALAEGHVGRCRQASRST
jgi:preprotein translocase subunit SecY